MSHVAEAAPAAAGDARAHGGRWAPIAAGATVALVRAGRAGARAYDLEAEIEGIERLSEAPAGAPGE